MARAEQFIAKPSRSPVMVICGRNRPMIHYCVQYLLGMIPQYSAVECFDASYTSITTFWDRLREQAPLLRHRTFVVRDVQRWSNWPLLDRYAAYPDASIQVVLTANALKRSDGERWLAKSKNVKYVDCGNLSDVSMLKFVQKAAGVSEVDANKILDRTYGDMSEIIRVVELCEVFDEPVVDALLPPVQRESPLVQYGLPQWEDGKLILDHLKRRFTQLLDVSLAAQSNKQILSISDKAEMDPFQVKLMLPVAQKASPQEWMRRLALLHQLEPYQHFPGLIRYLEMTVV